MGPRIVPWGTPDKTGDEDEQVPRLVHGWFTLGEILQCDHSKETSFTLPLGRGNVRACDQDA